MCCLPPYQEVVFPHFNQPDSPYHIARFHLVDLDEFYRPVRVSESDDHFRATLHYVNMRRAVLTGREEDPDREAA